MNKVHNILVEEVSPNNFKVVVTQGSTTEHHVTASKDFLNQFTKYNISPEKSVCPSIHPSITKVAESENVAI